MVRRTCLTTSLTASTTRRVAWNRHNWCAAVGQISASTAGYSVESSVITSAGPMLAAFGQERLPGRGAGRGAAVAGAVDALMLARACSRVT
jgi:hypothetical protein